MPVYRLRADVRIEAEDQEDAAFLIGKRLLTWPGRVGKGWIRLDAVQGFDDPPETKGPRT